MNIRLLALAAAIVTAPAAAAPGSIEIEFWHSMSGALGERIALLAEKFNASQTGYRVAPVFKGDNDESVAAAMAAFKAGKPPLVVQVSDAGTAAMVEERKAIRPVYQLMATAGEKFDPQSFYPAISSHYSDGHGRMLALPFNNSTAVFYFNRDAFRKAGLDPERAPHTWREVQQAALKIQESGAAECGITSALQSWVQIENISAWHDQPVATSNNGFGGTKARLNFSSELLIRHISLLSSWAKSHIFSYAGRGREAEGKFARGECAMLTSSSDAIRTFTGSAGFALGVAPLPYYDEFRGAPFNTIVGGDGLWVMAGRKPLEYKGVAKFFRFLLQPDIQADWQQQTGYLPATLAASELSRKQGYYERNPGADVALKEIAGRATPYSRGVRLGNLARIRAVIDEELEGVWNQTKTPKEALDNAVERGNEFLSRFEQAKKR